MATIKEDFIIEGSNWFGGAILAFLICLCGLMIADTAFATETIRTVHNITTESGVSGSFVYGTGSVESKPYYYVYTNENETYYKGEIGL